MSQGRNTTAVSVDVGDQQERFCVANAGLARWITINTLRS